MEENDKKRDLTQKFDPLGFHGCWIRIWVQIWNIQNGGSEMADGTMKIAWVCAEIRSKGFSNSLITTDLENCRQFQNIEMLNEFEAIFHGFSCWILPRTPCGTTVKNRAKGSTKISKWWNKDIKTDGIKIRWRTTVGC